MGNLLQITTPIINFLIFLGGLSSGITIIYIIIKLGLYLFIQKTTKLPIILRTTTKDVFQEIENTKREKLEEKYGLESQLIPEIKDLKNKIVAEITLDKNPNYVCILGSRDCELEIIKYLDKESNDITPINFVELKDIGQIYNKNEKLKLLKNQFVLFHTTETNPIESKKVQIKTKGHKETIELTPNLRIGHQNVIVSKNTISSFIAK
ncbi:hypothetical protein RGR08_03760 [Staphylococcus epidermidis]|uniref:hypothetical protein n=1 Tax=Staphylococcus epidermidis TaxID=1282 RepID=UPI0011A216F6|nr:hypothetical protein [Staphylococcus epidermidis]